MLRRHLTLCLILISPLPVFGQLAPGIGYVFPPVVTAGKPADVVLGGYDWTPDMQLLVRDSDVQMETTGDPSDVIVPEPPYWFGKKARRAPFLLPRETPARIQSKDKQAAGIVLWQAANANGATAIGKFLVSDRPVVVEVEDREHAQRLPPLPIDIAARIKHIQEVDRFEFAVDKDQLVTCAITARAINSDLNAAVDIRDASGRLVASAADTAGNDVSVTFTATANVTYTASVYDVDFRGNRAFVYCMSLTTGPRVVAAIPSAGNPGETRPVEFIGYGVHTGEPRLESVIHEVSFPANPKTTSLNFQLPNKQDAAAFSLSIDELPVAVEVAADGAPQLPQPVAVPSVVFGSLDERYGSDLYQLTAAKGDLIAIIASSQRSDVPLDLAVAILDDTAKELARNDDLAGTVDAGLEFKVPNDGVYTIAVSDISGNSGNRAAVYRLSVEPAEPNFTISIPELLNAPLGGKAKLTVQASRTGGFKDPIALSIVGLPDGVSLPDDPVIPANKPSASFDLTVAADAPATASLATIIGEATIGERSIRQTSKPMLVATTITPPFEIDAEGKDDVTKWPRGSTFPAPVLIQREEGFDKEIVLEMTSRQGRHRQGIRGPELVVPPGVERILYPVFLPEWLETTRTSRMVVNGVARVEDPRGNTRYSVSRQKTRMGFLPGGAMLKISSESSELSVEAGTRFSVPLTIDRAVKLTEPARVELIDTEHRLPFQASSTIRAADTSEFEFEIAVDANAPAGEYQVPIRATVMMEQDLPVISETRILVTIKQPAG